MSHADQRFDREGWRYGVRFHDGSVLNTWNGPTQRMHATNYVEASWAHLATRPRHDGLPWIDTFTLVRHRDGEDWEDVV